MVVYPQQSDRKKCAVFIVAKKRRKSLRSGGNCGNRRTFRKYVESSHEPGAVFDPKAAEPCFMNTEPMWPRIRIKL
jgi:hypothetical protein